VPSFKYNRTFAAHATNASAASVNQSLRIPYRLLYRK
jgi:hypothetical protein